MTRRNCGARTHAQCRKLFPELGRLHKLWGRPPGLRGSPWTRCLVPRINPRGYPKRSARGPTADEGVRPTIYAAVLRWEKYAALRARARRVETLLDAWQVSRQPRPCVGTSAGAARTSACATANVCTPGPGFRLSSEQNSLSFPLRCPGCRAFGGSRLGVLERHCRRSHRSQRARSGNGAISRTSSLAMDQGLRVFSFRRPV